MADPIIYRLEVSDETISLNCTKDDVFKEYHWKPTSCLLVFVSLKIVDKVPFETWIDMEIDKEHEGSFIDFLMGNADWREN